MYHVAEAQETAHEARSATPAVRMWNGNVRGRTPPNGRPIPRPSGYWIVDQQFTARQEATRGLW
ncbi:MAG: hypothetical protein WBC51_23650 [Vicinamibacterales bacterium]